MRRGIVILLLCVALLGAGAACLYLPQLTKIPGFTNPQANKLLAQVFFLLCGFAGLSGAFCTNIACRMLSKRLLRLENAGPLKAVESPHPDLAPLVKAVNGVIEYAADSIARAELRVKELEIQLKVATAERQHAEAIIYSISDAVLVTDPFDDLLLANDSAARAFNFDLASSSRAPVQKLLSDEKLVSLIREMRQSDTKGGRRIIEHRSAGPSGERTFKVTLSCVNTQGDHTAGVVAVLHDMTREKEIAQMKNDFVSNVSHELRTPLASIKAYAEMLIDGEATDDKTRTEFYEVIHNEANRLGRLIDNILNISRIESGLVKINKKPQSLTVILKEAIEVISPQAKQKQIAIEETIAPAVYQTVADRDMIYEAVLNLMSNAVKYTPAGGTLRIETLVDEALKKITTRISDTGVGIPPKDLPFVFDKFYRVESNNRMAKGTGLGLSLVKHIIETVHHGRIFVESQVGKGSTFGFDLDLVE